MVSCEAVSSAPEVRRIVAVVGGLPSLFSRKVEREIDKFAS